MNARREAVKRQTVGDDAFLRAAKADGDGFVEDLRRVAALTR